MGRKQNDKKEKQPKATPTPKKPKIERKRCKSPRGVKLAKVKDRLLDVVDAPHKRHRNDYNHRMAQVAKLARML
jgi:hypothetical protein